MIETVTEAHGWRCLKQGECLSYEVECALSWPCGRLLHLAVLEALQGRVVRVVQDANWLHGVQVPAISGKRASLN